MHGEYIEICPVELRKQMRERGLTHADLAMKLQISTKSVQRWLNQSIKRMKIENLQKLALVLNVDPALITKQKASIRSQLTNKPFDDLCSEHLIHRVLANDDWNRYANLLKSFDPKDLSSLQEGVLYRNLGWSMMHMGKMKAAKIYLDRAITISESLADFNNAVTTLIFHSMRCKLIGDIKGAQTYLERSEVYLASVTNPRLPSLFYAQKARLLTHQGNLQDAVRMTRRALYTYYRTSKPNMVFVTRTYLNLTHIYMRARDFKQATISARRAQEAAQKAGWVKALAMTHMLLGVLIHLNEGMLRQDRFKHYGKARSLKNFMPNRCTDLRFEQLEFLKLVLNGEYVKAKSVAVARLQAARSNRLNFSYAVLDLLLLARLVPNSIALRPSLIEKAEETFRRNQMSGALDVMSALKNKDKIELNDLKQIYLF